MFWVKKFVPGLWTKGWKEKKYIFFLLCFSSATFVRLIGASHGLFLTFHLNYKIGLRPKLFSNFAIEVISQRKSFDPILFGRGMQEQHEIWLRLNLAHFVPIMHRSLQLFRFPSFDSKRFSFNVSLRGQPTPVGNQFPADSLIKNISSIFSLIPTCWGMFYKHRRFSCEINVFFYHVIICCDDSFFCDADKNESGAKNIRKSSFESRWKWNDG